MKLLCIILLAVPVFGQTDTPATAPESPKGATEAQPDTPNQANRSVLEVKPGEEALKQKDRYEASGIFHPFLRMPKFVLRDQKAIWTSPFHTAKGDAKWWAIWGGATVALVATDKYTAKHLPNTN